MTNKRDLNEFPPPWMKSAGEYQREIDRLTEALERALLTVDYWRDMAQHYREHLN